VLPACAEHDYKDILDQHRVNRVYHEVCIKGG
jgi:hypothetical protein